MEGDETAWMAMLIELLAVVCAVAFAFVRANGFMGGSRSMRRLTPRPPRLSFLHRPLARLPLGAPTGFACAAAGVACMVGLVFVGPRLGIPLGYSHDGQGPLPAVASATNAPAPTGRPKAPKAHLKKVSAPAGFGPFRTPPLPTTAGAPVTRRCLTTRRRRLVTRREVHPHQP